MKITWLASYPKSGNTWFRSFLMALENNGNVFLHQLSAKAGHFASRHDFSLATDLDSSLLYAHEARVLLPEVYRLLAGRQAKPLFVKTHDAFSYNKNNEPIVPQDATLCALYFIRNPLDIVGSLANHNQISIADAVAFLLNDNQYISPSFGNLNTGDVFPQVLLNWAQHVNSWALLPTFAVHIVRYEDMLTDTFSTFKKALGAMNYDDFTDEEIMRACEACKFDTLKEQEQSKPFAERLKPGVSFFRKGVAGGWKAELTSTQVAQITAKYGREMLAYGYL